MAKIDRLAALRRVRDHWKDRDAGAGWFQELEQAIRLAEKEDAEGPDLIVRALQQARHTYHGMAEDHWSHQCSEGAPCQFCQALDAAMRPSAAQALLREAIQQWPQIGRDTPIQGSDAVDWLVTFIRKAKKILD